MAFRCQDFMAWSKEKSFYRSSYRLQKPSNKILLSVVLELSYFSERSIYSKFYFYRLFYTSIKVPSILQSKDSQNRSLFGIVHLPLSLLVPLQYFHPHTSQTPTPSVVKAVWNYQAAGVLARSHHSTASGHWAVISHKSHQLDSSAARNNK